MRLREIFEIISYETFLLSQYHIETEGLHHKNGYYFIHCPNIGSTTLAIDGTNIHEWFSKHKILGSNISLVSEVPEGAEKVELSNETNSFESGYLITRGDFEYEIDLLIPKIFPDYTITNTYPLKIIFGDDVSDEGMNELRRIFIEAKFPVPVTFENGNKPPARGNSGSIFQTLIPHRQIKSKLSTLVADAWEEDEDNWIHNRKNIIYQKPENGNPYKPDSFTESLRCLIDCSNGSADNIRNYLTMYEQVCIVAPDTSEQSKALSSLGITVDELKELVHLNKVHLLLPRSIEVYDQKLVHELIEVNKSNIHLARSISAMTFMEMRKRNPFLLPSITIEQKQLLLHEIETSVMDSIQDKKLQDKVKKVISDTGNSWIRLPNSMNQLDYGLFSHFGTSDIIRSMLEFRLDRDLSIEFDLSAPPVEWAAATGSVLIPTNTDGYDTEPLSSLVAEIYSGTPDSNWILQNRSIANFSAENILAIGKHLPVVELATSFNGAEVSRFRNLILKISKQDLSADELNKTINEFNAFVKKYEKNKDNLNAWNVKGFILGLAGKGISGIAAGASGIPLPSWLLGHVVKQVTKRAEKNSRLSETLDSIESSIMNTTPDAILVSKMRDKIKKKL